MEKRRLTNFLRVTTNVTTREGHSVVRTNTPLIHTYCVTQLLRMYSQSLGTAIPANETGSVIQ